MRRPLILGHRGASAERPENTLAAFDLARKRGADALELDVHLTLDDVVVVSHDESGRRMAGVPRDIRELPLAAVRAWDVGFGYRAPDGSRPYLGCGYCIPTLDEVLEAFPGVPLNVDIKQREPAMESAVIDVIRRHQAEARVLLASFDDDVLARVRALGYRGPTGLGRRELQRLLTLPATLITGGPAAIRGQAAQVPLAHGPLRFDRPAFVRKCHRLGIRVDYWTINDVATARRLAALGADGLFTDDPGRLHPAWPAGVAAG